MLLISLSVLQSCYVTHPRYATVDEVMLVKPGMHRSVADSILTTTPYDIVSKDTTGMVEYLYKYRTIEVRRVPKAMKRNEGLDVEGGFKDLILTCDSTDTIVDLRTSEERWPSKVKTRKIDAVGILNSVTTFVSVTLPALLVYLSAN